MAQTLSKEEAVSRLERIIKQSKEITTDTFEHTGWVRTAKVAIDRIFGPGSKQSKEFAATRSLVTGQRVLLVSMLQEVQDDWDDSNTDLTNPSVDAPSSAALESEVKPSLVSDPRIVFVVHGRNLSLRDSLFRFLRSINLRPLEWSQVVNATNKPNPYIGQVLDTAFSTARAVVVLMTPDDQARLRSGLRKPDDLPFESQLAFQSRPNVIFEAGLAMGRAAKQTILVEIGTLRPFSDIGGLHIISLDNSTERRQQLAQRLKNAGCEVDLTGTDWHREGDFSLRADEDLDPDPS